MNNKLNRYEKIKFIGEGQVRYTIFEVFHFK